MKTPVRKSKPQPPQERPTRQLLPGVKEEVMAGRVSMKLPFPFDSGPTDDMVLRDIHLMLQELLLRIPHAKAGVE